MRCLIVDDDPVAATVLAHYAAESGDLDVVGMCSTPAEALRALRQQPVDLLLLDMEMPGMSGLELLAALDRRPQVVLVTGNPDYAVDAFEADVVDYLVKPVSYARFLKAVSKVHRLSAPRREDRELFIRTEGRIVRVPMDDIDRVEADKDYVRVHSGAKSYRVHATMKEMAERLPAAAFVRVHRSHLVRLDRIVDLEQDSLVVGKAVVPVGDSYRAALMARLDAV